MMEVLGIDLGANNIKAILLKEENNEILVNQVQLKRLNTSSLQEDLEYCKEYLNLSSNAMIYLVNSVTGYSASNEQGLENLNKILTRVFAQQHIYHITINGDCVSIGNTGRYSIYHYMGTNSYPSAYLASKFIENGIMIDIGTSSTDVISIKDYQPYIIAGDLPHWNRLETGELSFSGTLYTQLEYLVHEVPFRGGVTKICPGIAWTGHIYALLEKINSKTIEEEFKSVWNFDDAHYRIARFLCYDKELVSKNEAIEVSKYVHQMQIDHVTNMTKKVLERVFLDTRKVPIIASGIGSSIIIDHVARRMNTPMIRLFDRINLPFENCLSALGVAVKGWEHLTNRQISESEICNFKWAVVDYV